MCSEERKKQGKKFKTRLIPQKRNHFMPDSTMKPISPFGLVQPAVLGFCLLHSSVKIWKTDFFKLLLTAPRPFLFRKKYFFLTVMYRCSVPFMKKKHMSDHGQGFLFLKCLLLLLPCQCFSEENNYWKRPLFGFALSMETGPQQGLGGQQAAFTRLLLCTELFQQPGHLRKDALVSCAPLCCPCFPEHWARVGPRRKGLIRSGE